MRTAVAIETQFMYQWYVVYSKPSNEALAAREIANQGFEVFLPMIAKDRESTAYPLFPRYMFVCLDMRHRWQSIYNTRGVSTLIGNGGFPTAVPSRLVEEIRSRSDENGCVFVNDQDNKRRAEPDDYCRVSFGPFKDFEGVCKSSAKNRVVLLLDMFGSKRETAIDPNDVEVINSSDVAPIRAVG